MIAALKIYRRNRWREGEREEREAGSDFANVEKAGKVLFVRCFGEHCAEGSRRERRRRKWKSTREMKKKSSTGCAVAKGCFMCQK